MTPMEDLETRALALLETGVAENITPGAGDNDTRVANLEGWRRLRLRPHVLRDVTAVDTSTTVLGIPVAAPILVAQTAVLRARGKTRAILEAACEAGARAIVASVDAGAVPYGRGATELGAHVA